jgi:hypothetical protein
MSSLPDCMANDSIPVSERAFERRVWLLAMDTFAIGTDANVISGVYWNGCNAASTTI